MQSPVLHVRGLHPEASSRDLVDLFSPFGAYALVSAESADGLTFCGRLGPVVRVLIVQSKNHAFVQMVCILFLAGFYPK